MIGSMEPKIEGRTLGSAPYPTGSSKPPGVSTGLVLSALAVFGGISPSFEKPRTAGQMKLHYLSWPVKILKLVGPEKLGDQPIRPKEQRR